MNSLDRRNSFRLGLSLLVLIILVGCYGETAQIVLDQRLPRTIDLQASNYSKHLYVSVSTGSDENDGTHLEVTSISYQKIIFIVRIIGG
jgi:hypothetical protein